MPVNFPFEGRGGGSKFDPVLAGGRPAPTLAPAASEEENPSSPPKISPTRTSEAAQRARRAIADLREVFGPRDELVGVKSKILEMQNELRRRLPLIRAGETVEATNKTAQGSIGVVPFVSNISATESPTKVDDRTLSLVSVSFDRPSDISNWAFARIAISGYKGNPNFVFIAEGSQSPVSFLLESTDETIVIAVGSMNGQGKTNDIALAPTTAVDLDGVVSAPPNPTITQNLTGLPLGFQFQFSQLSGLSTDVVDSYRIYRHTADVSGSSSLIQTINHNSLNSGSVTVQDFPGANLTRYYWVSAVNLAGLESSLVAAHTGATTNTGIGAGDSDLDLDDVPDGTRTAFPTGTEHTDTVDGGNRARAGLDGGGDLARNITLARANSSNVLRRTSGGLYAGNLAATLGATWGTDVNSRPVELTDGRVSAGLDSVGDLSRNVVTNRVVEGSILAGAVALAKQKADSLARMFTADAKRTNVEGLENNGELKAVRFNTANFGIKTLANNLLTSSKSSPATGWVAYPITASLDVPQETVSLELEMVLPTEAAGGSRRISTGIDNIGFSITSGAGPATPQVSRQGNGSLTQSSPVKGAGLTLTLYINFTTGTFLVFGGAEINQDTVLPVAIGKVT